MSALSYLQQKNGLKTTQTVVNKQQSGEDAEQKANPVLQASTLTESQLQDAGKRIDEGNNAAAQNDAMKERTIATQQAIQKGVNVNQDPDPENDDDIANIPVVNQDETPKRMSYADMFKAMYGNGEEETEEQKKKRLKRERTNAIISSVGDGLRALSNMYFATKNAKVNHNPEQDMSATMLKRKQLLDTQREKNRAAWLKGYQKAQELDENARKNDMTAAEAVRYHNQLAEIAARKGDQNDRKLDQNQQKIDLTKWKYTTDADFHERELQLDEWYKENKISTDQYNAETKRMREQRIASKAKESSQGDKSTAGYWHEYYEMMETPEGQKKVRDILRKIKAKDANQHNIRYIMDKLKGRSSSGGGKNPSQHKNTTSGRGKKKKRPY
ncbi:hypothetical protein [uncultured Prevotella sp.]|jgi:hypothetical protein|uniref:hypothetical protein n=1 Tax=uncultured Prevotella sp. TaxID=159272 RepID=UPI0027DCAF65|nr:hypothetical protein [uncultured Prevotella sp.]